MDCLIWQKAQGTHYSSNALKYYVYDLDHATINGIDSSIMIYKLQARLTVYTN